jgi:RNA polymerase sigma factor (sigma-70 family)
LSHNDIEHQNQEELTDEFESHLEAVVSEIFPTLCDRIAHSGFAGWHRRMDKEEDLAQQAAFQFLRHFKKKQELPEDPLRYLVVIARNIAKREYGRFQRSQAEFEEYASGLLAKGEPTTGETVESDALIESEEHVEIVRAAIDVLPRRQRQAFELRTLDPSATYKELGKQMGISEDGFRKNFERADEHLRKLLLTQIKRK